MALGIALALAFGTMLLYLPVQRNGFVYDDELYVVFNPHVRAGLNAADVRWALTTDYAANWHPLTWLSLQLDNQRFGLKSGNEVWSHASGYHITNVLLHAANAVLVFVALRRMTGALWPPALVGALFAIHPLHVESVAWVSERKDVLSTFFGLLAIVAYAGYTERRGWARYTTVLALYALSLLAKPMLVTLPFLLLLLDYWPLGRFRLSPLAPRPSPLRLILGKLPLLALAAGSSFMTMLAQKAGGAVTDMARYPLGVRVGNAAVSYVRYLGLAIWPHGLAPFYPHPGSDLSAAAVAASAALLAAVTLLAVWQARRRPYLLVGWLWYLGTLVPVIGLVQVGEQAMADRYTYVPLIGPFVALAWGLQELVERRKLRAPAAGVACVAALAACAVVTVRQLPYWRDNRSLWEHTLAVTRRNYVAEYNLALALDRENGRPDEAKPHYASAIRIEPRYWDAYLNLALVYGREENWAEAEDLLRRGIAAAPGAGKLYRHLAHVLLQQGKAVQAVAPAQTAVRLQPEDAEARYQLGSALSQTGRLDDAARELREAIRLNPNLAAAQDEIGKVLLLQGQVAEAVGRLRTAVRLEPRFGRFYYDLAFALDRAGDVAGARDALQKGVQLYPEWPRDANQDAWTQATDPDPDVRNGLMAVRLAGQLCRLTDDRQADFLDTLAAALAEAGRFREAVDTEAKAIGRLGSGSAASPVREAMEARRKLYESSRPYRRPPGQTGKWPTAP